jgi:predicted membrane protein
MRYILLQLFWITVMVVFTVLALFYTAIYIVLLSYLTWTAWRWETAAFMIGVSLFALPISRAVIIRRIREQAATGGTGENS